METSLALAARQFSAWSRDEFIERVRLFSDQFNPGQPGYGSPEDFNWTFDATFKLSRVAGTADDWAHWSVEEKAAWVEDYAPDAEEEIETYWLPEPWLDPVIVAEGTDGLFYAWDGNHRIGVAFATGLADVPAIMGLRTGQPSGAAPKFATTAAEQSLIHSSTAAQSA